MRSKRGGNTVKKRKRKSRRQRSEWSLLRSKFKRQNPERKCAFCCVTNEIVPKQTFQVDHCKPKRVFPELELELTNLQWLCSHHNQSKGSKYPYLYTGLIYERLPCDSYPSDTPTS